MNKTNVTQKLVGLSLLLYLVAIIALIIGLSKTNDFSVQIGFIGLIFGLLSLALTAGIRWSDIDQSQKLEKKIDQILKNTEPTKPDSVLVKVNP